MVKLYHTKDCTMLQSIGDAPFDTRGGAAAGRKLGSGQGFFAAKSRTKLLFFSGFYCFCFCHEVFLILFHAFIHCELGGGGRLF